MPPVIAGSGTLNVGIPTVIEARSPASQYSAVFEDDGETGYFYGLDTTRVQQPIVDAMQIYNVDFVTDKDRPSVVEIVWSSDAMKCALFINRFIHALFDFEARRGYCRSGFPPDTGGWSQFGHTWSEAVPNLID